jgi:activator of HSP90 ATPase
MATKSITQDYTINAPIEAVYKALTDGPTAEEWGAAPAKVEAKEGGAFSYWDGDIHGIFTKLVPSTLIELDWYGHDNPSWKYTVSFTLEGNDETTTVHMIFTGNIVDEQKDIADWKDYYFEPIKKLLEKDSE